MIGDTTNAEKIFKKVIRKYTNDTKTKAYSKYGLAWLAEQSKDYKKALNILDHIIKNDNCKDSKLLAAIYFKQGAIYLFKLSDFKQARRNFQKLVELYPKSRQAQYSFVKDIRTP